MVSIQYQTSFASKFRVIESSALEIKAFRVLQTICHHTAQQSLSPPLGTNPGNEQPSSQT